jgi:hypothetical protein
MVYNYQIIVFVNISATFDHIVNNLILEKLTKYKLDYIVGNSYVIMIT